MSAKHAVETALVATLAAAIRTLPWRASLAAGAALGTLARWLGVRVRVARDNLGRALPELDEAAREAILAEHYRELGRVVAEYARLGALARSREPLREIRGREHLERARAAGRGAILLSGHFGNVELVAGILAQEYPVHVVTRRMSNPGVERWIAARRAEAGLGLIPVETGLRAIYAALRANRFVAMLADQDAGRDGVFVPFFGRPASTAPGPARLSLATGAPIVMGFAERQADGHIVVEVDAPPALENPDGSDAVERLTALHVARLEARVRRDPASWFWLHRRWKTAAPS